MIFEEKLSIILLEAAAMADALKRYLERDELFMQLIVHTPEGDRLPKMTLGGLLEKARYLGWFKEELSGEDLKALNQILDRITDARLRSRDRYARRLGREFKSFLDSWHWYMDDVVEGSADALDRYPQEVRIRDRLDLLEQEGDKVQSHFPLNKLEEEDRRLRRIWKRGDFIWPEKMKNLYPPERYWWLYGKPGVPR